MNRPGEPALEPGLADVITLERRKAAALSCGDEQSLFLDTVAEYQWARDTAGLAPATLDGLTKPIIEICRHYGVVPWRLTRARSTAISPASASGSLDGAPQDDADRSLLRVPGAAVRR